MKLSIKTAENWSSHPPNSVCEHEVQQYYRIKEYKQRSSGLIKNKKIKFAY